MMVLVPAQAQDLGSPQITNYDTEALNASAQNWVAVQDRRGIMYFGNSTGILEFDGQRWHLIAMPQNPLTRCLATNPEGTIFYGTIGDFGYLAPTPSGHVAAISVLDKIPKEDRDFNDVWQVLSGRDGMYFLTRTSIFRFHENKVTVFDGKLASSQACVLNGALLYADSERGICLVNEDRSTAIPGLAEVYNGQRINLAPFSKHELLVARISGDFLLIDLAAFWNEATLRYDIDRPLTRAMVRKFPTELDTWLPDSKAYLYKLDPIGPDRFAISTIKAGILIFDRSGKIIRAIDKEAGLLDNTAIGLFINHSGNLWVATNSGISHVELNVPQSFFGSHNGIEGISICAQLHQGKLYVGTFLNLLVQVPYRYAMNESLPRFKPVRNSPSEIWQLMDIEGDLMAASGRGLFMVEDEAAHKVAGSSPHAYCLGISRLWPGHLFVGLMEGLEVFKRVAGKWVTLGRVKGVSENIRRITEDNNGMLWLSTDAKGLLRIDFVGDSPLEVEVDSFGLEHGLPDLSGIRSAFHGTMLYALSQKGLFSTRITPKQKDSTDQIRFTPDLELGQSFNEKATEISVMVADGRDGYYFSTTNGVAWVLPDHNGRFRTETRPFKGLRPSAESIYAHPDGSVWLPGRTLLRVEPRAIKDYEQSFDVLIRKATSTNGSLSLESANNTTAPDLIKITALPYREHNLSFEFSASFYEKPGNTQYQYLLEGFDKRWSEWATDYKKEYTNLPEGQYRFRVRAQNVYGTRGREAEFRLRILPPWHRTWWAYIIWFITTASGLIGLIYLYTLKLRREKLKLETLVAERTRQLREASLTDPLTGLRNRRFISEILQNDVAAFVGFKTYLLHAGENRSTSTDKTVFGLFLVDIDFFKSVNDDYGHTAGDQILKEFATILTSLVRQDDSVVRVGGEEFLVVLKKTDPDYLPVFAGKILEKVANTDFHIDTDTIIRKTCSIGYAAFPFYPEHPDLLSFDQSIMVADLALYKAKTSGRNRSIYLKPGPLTPSGQERCQKTVSSLDYSLQEGYIQMS